jgi:hypothetical protein
MMSNQIASPSQDTGNGARNWRLDIVAVALGVIAIAIYAVSYAMCWSVLSKPHTYSSITSILPLVWILLNQLGMGFNAAGLILSIIALSRNPLTGVRRFATLAIALNLLSFPVSFALYAALPS